jgi:hypothetical protein
MERTKKQWHRYFVEEIAKIISDTTDNNDVFVECGVKQGSSSVRMGKNLNIDGHLFDTWHGFPNFSDLDVHHDKDRRQMENRIKNSSDTFDDCVNALKKHGLFDSCNMVRGDILKTVPSFVSNLTDFSIAMMHIDTDLYDPAKISLESFWGYVKEGGVVYFHDYGDKKWRGIKKVVDDLIERDSANLFFHVFDDQKLFSACIVKGTNEISKEIFNKIVSLDS